ncbi:MAG: diguanylate cyclase [Candidatus Obscuribacterales bacterium]|nr:diguanylate cyclase [Candidatus Obscuribacterales bacterium]
MKDPSACVLIVDDQPADVALVAEFLKGSGMTVTVVADGFKALAACKVRTPDIILLDLQMPIMSGTDVLNRLTAEEKTKNIPVVFLRPAEAKLALAKEHDDYPLLVKPLEPQDVLSLVKTVLREKTLKDELKKKEAQLKELTLTDPLTSCRNSRYLMEFLRTELRQCVRYEHPLSVLVIEVDSAKELARFWNASTGTEPLLSQLATVMNRGNRKADLLSRTGQAEFVLVLPFTNAEGAVEVAERVRTGVDQNSFIFGEDTEKFTVSIGVCQFKPKMDTTGETLLSFARAAMHQAKEAGGNQTFVAE